MALINDCSPQNAVDVYNQKALDNLVQQFQSQIQDLQTQMTEVDAAVTGLQDTLDNLLQGSGIDPDVLRQDSCALPKVPTAADIENRLTTVPDLRVIEGRMVLRGTLSLVAYKRLYGIYGDLGAVSNLIPEMYPVILDPVYGTADIPTRLLVLCLRRTLIEAAAEPCGPTPDPTETETLVSVDQTLPADDEDGTRVVVAIWIGDVILSDAQRAWMVQMGFTDEEIIDTTLLKSSERFEVYQIQDPARLGRYLAGFGEADDSFLSALLTRGLDSVNDTPTTDDTVAALKQLLTTPASPGCGISPSIALMATIDLGNLLLPSHPDDCPAPPNIFGDVNRMFGAMGTLKQAINKVMLAFQRATGPVIARLADLTSYAERNLLGVGLYSTGFNLNYGISPVSLAGVPTNVAGIPNPPTPANVTLASAEQFTHQLEHQIGLFTDAVNATMGIITGMSLMACALSEFGHTVSRFNVHMPSFPALEYNMPGCAKQHVTATLDLSGLTFDWMNQTVADLIDILHRMDALITALTRQQHGPDALFKLQCSLTETSQLAVDISRRFAAQNFGRF